MASPKDLPEFERPPVIEVVCGVLFKELTSLLAAHLGLLWEKYQSEYPNCQEVAPLAPEIEQFDAPQTVTFDMVYRPPLPRTWFVHEDDNGIVQVQRDRFLHNWKKVCPDDEYPRYGQVIRLFRDRLSTFESFVADMKLGAMEPQQYEITYVNHIPRGEGWNRLTDLAKVFPDFAWRTEPTRFLPTPEKINHRTSFLLPDRSGRLHATIRTALRKSDKTELLLLDLTARGMPADASRDGMWAWFNLAHEWIVRGFADLTGDHMHQDVWSRTK